MASKRERGNAAARGVGLLAAAALIACLAPATARGQSGMGRAEATQLYSAAGYRIVNEQPLNRCGRPARPRVTFVDLNADRQPEALFVDADTACFAPDGRWFAVLVRGRSGWQPVAAGAGSIEALPTRTAGWLDMRISAAGCARPYRFDGQRYAPAGGCGEALVAAQPAQPSTRRPAPPPGQAPAAAPAVTAAGTTDKLSAADEAAAFQAAGFKKRGGKWRSDCDDPGTASYSPGAVERAGDFNGDGRPDAVLTEGGTFCYGNTGTGYWLVSRRADGGWALMDRNTGMLEFLKTSGADGWPDILVGGPGFCFPVTRWNGREYKLNRWEYEGKACKPPR